MQLPTPPKLEEHDPSVSDMAIEYLSYHLELYRARQDQFEALKKEPNSAFKSGNVPQLREVAVGGIVKALREDLHQEAVGIITDAIPPHLLESVMNDPRIPYSAFRRINAKRMEDVAAGEGDEVDEWIQKNEKWMRVDETGLVTLDDAKAIFPTAAHTSTEIIILRRQPPPASFCFLDQKRPSSLSILPSTDRFIETFNRVTNNCLKGLDWNNVFLAGGMPLNILLCTDPSMDNTFAESDLDIYIYGLNPDQANEKIKHIYSVWSTNVGEKSVKAGICVKNTKTVNFLGKFPDRRIQIVLKIIKSPVEVLLNFDLDPCAIGFDGTRVLMLPRAARALETGYTTFTMHLVHGHHLGDRRATQELRIYKYASRGFGIRILPCYMDDLVLDFKKRGIAPIYFRWGNRQSDQQLVKGLKAVKRIAFAAEDMVRRFVLNEVDGRDASGRGDDEWEEFDNRNWATTPQGRVPLCSFKTLDALKQHIGQPGGRLGIGRFELLLRHCAAWKLECEGRLKIDYNDFADTYATEGAYDDLPSFSWNEDFRAEKFMRDIDTYNLCLHRNMLGLFDHMEDGRNREEECQLGRMAIRPARMTYAKNFQGVMDQQLAIPVFIPQELEGRFESTYKNAMKLAGLNDPLFHNQVDSNGDLMVRLWLIGNQTMWARIDRTIDEIFESLWTFFHIQQLTPGYISAVYGEDEDYFDESTLQSLIRSHLERRVPRPEVPGRNVDTNPGEGGVQGFFTWPSEEEKQLFDIWMRDYPLEVYRGLDAPFGSTSSFNEADNLKEPDEDKYWGSDDEKEEARVWRDIVEEVKRKRKRIDSQLIEGEKFARV